MIQWMNTGDSYWRTSNTAWLLLVVKQLKGARRYLRILPTSVDEVIHKQINSPSTKILHRINRILVASESYTCCFRFGTSSQKTTLTLHGSWRFQKKRCTYNLSRWLPGLGSPSSSGKTRTHQCHKPPWSWPAFPDFSQPWFPQRPWKQGQHGQLQVRIKCSGP